MNTQRSMTEAAALPAWVLDHPLTRKIMEERADGILKQRTAARKEIDKLQKEAAGCFPALKAAIVDAETELGFWEDQGRALKRKHSVATAALAAVKFTLGRGIQKQEAILFETRDPAIDEAILFFRDRTTEIRLPSAIHRSAFKGPKHPANNKQEVRRSTNRPAVMEAIGYMTEAIKELERMKLSPECDVVRIEALKTEIPSIDALTESEAYERVIPED